MVWSKCAETSARELVTEGVQEAWPLISALPTSIQTQVVSLGETPTDALHDGVTQVLYLVSESNAFYLEQTGGFAGLHQLYGPISLKDRCAAASKVSG